MSRIRITDSGKGGELRWSLVLIDKENRSVVQSTELLSRGSALAVAKVLKHKVCDHAAGVPVGREWQFELIDNTRFCLLDGGDCTAVPDVAKDLLAEVEIEWDPPEADPACREKKDDRTPTKGIPGS